MRWVLVGLGTLFVGLAILGVLLPLLPTTPFLLLAAACFARSSDRLYHWLLNQKHLGRFIKDYREKRGIALPIKLFTLSLLWLTIGFSVVYAVDLLWVRLLLLVIAVGVTTHVLNFPTLKR